MAIIRLLLLLTAFSVVNVAADDDRAEVKPLSALKVADGLYMLSGHGGNIGVSLGEDGLFVIDDQVEPVSAEVQKAIEKLSPQPIKFLLNTHWHYDHTGGNHHFGSQGAIIVAHDNVRSRLLSGGVIEAFNREIAPATAAALPVVTFADEITFHWNGELIKVEHEPAAHTDGDAVIYFDKANVVHMGDTFFNGFYPFIDAGNGGTLLGLIKAVTNVLAKVDDATKIIPGHGALAGKTELLAYHEMLKTIYGRLLKLKRAGKSVEQAIAAKPTADFDAAWGKGLFTADQWVGIVYRTL